MRILKKLKSLREDLLGPADALHWIVYYIPLAFVLPFYLYCLVFEVGLRLFDARIGFTPSLDLDLVGEFFRGFILGPTQFNPLVILWNCLVLACGMIFFLNAGVIAPLLILYFIFKTLALPFKPQALYAIGEFSIGLLGGASIFLVLGLFSEETSYYRVVGAVIGFCGTVGLIILNVRS